MFIYTYIYIYTQYIQLYTFQYRYVQYMLHTHTHTHTHRNFFMHSSVDGHVGFLHALAIVNTAAMNTGVCVSFGIMVFSGYIPRSMIAGS